MIGDISTPKERGGFFGMFNLGPMVSGYDTLSSCRLTMSQLSPCVAPVLGGVLSDTLGWRSIFWFLTISAIVCMMLIILFVLQAQPFTSSPDRQAGSYPRL